jgi:uncharacterized Zn finger protein (UPF0148 family)
VRTVENLGLCPKCGADTDTFRHIGAKVWCPKCGFVVREEQTEFTKPVEEKPFDLGPFVFSNMELFMEQHSGSAKDFKPDVPVVSITLVDILIKYILNLRKQIEGIYTPKELEFEIVKEWGGSDTWGSPRTAAQAIHRILPKLELARVVYSKKDEDYAQEFYVQSAGGDFVVSYYEINPGNIRWMADFDSGFAKRFDRNEANTVAAMIKNSKVVPAS